MLERVLFGLGVAVFVFLGGLAVGRYRLPPSTQIDEAIEAARDLRRNWRSYAGLVPTKHVVRADANRGPDRPPAVSAEAQPGVTLLTGLFDNEVSAVLVGLDGSVLHRWPIRFGEVWGEAAHLGPTEVPLNDWDTMIHGIVLFPNGDIVFNLEDRGLARMDRCGEVLWRLPYRTHHAVTTDEGGKLWVVGLKQPSTDPDPRFPGLRPPYRHETILQVDPDTGQILQEISLLEVIYRSRYEGVLFADGSEWPGDRNRGVSDPLHANHVEVLSSELAPAFPLFAPGDILVSLRNINLVAVLDGRTHKIKWSQTGPWVRQHEPQFRPDGRIAVFDNRRIENVAPWAGARPPFASEIVTIDPRTDQVSVLFEGTKAQPFFTGQMGKHQYLANGNILITEPRAGRAFEVTPDGRIVWWFVNRFDDRRIAKLSQATRYPSEFAAFAAAGCPVSAPAAIAGDTTAPAATMR